MSLLAGPGRDAVTLYPETTTQDAAGNPVRTTVGANPTTVYGLVQPVAAAEADGSTQRSDVQVRFICKDFPAGAWSRAVWDGRVWDVDAEPARRVERGQVRHATVVLRARTGEAVGAWS